MGKTRSVGKSKANVKDDPGLKQFLRTQEKITEDYLDNPRPRHRSRSCAYTLVRDPQGNYCLVSETKCPIPIKDKAEVAQLTQFLNDLNELVSDYLAKHCGHRELIAGPGVHVGTPEIFPK
jgi:hypothetical protein